MSSHQLGTHLLKSLNLVTDTFPKLRSHRSECSFWEGVWDILEVCFSVSSKSLYSQAAGLGNISNIKAWATKNYSVKIWDIEPKVGEEKRSKKNWKRKKILLFTSHICAMLNYCQQLSGIMVKLLAKAPFMIWPFQFSGASEWSTAGARSRTCFNTGLKYPCSICSHLLLQTCRTAMQIWPQGEGGIQIHL